MNMNINSMKIKIPIIAVLFSFLLLLSISSSFGSNATNATTNATNATGTTTVTQPESVSTPSNATTNATNATGTMSNLTKMNFSLNSINNTRAIFSALKPLDIMTLVNNQQWTNSSNHKLNVTDVAFTVFSGSRLSGMTCTLLGKDRKISQSEKCLYNNVGHVEYNNLSGSYTFRVNAHTSGVNSSIIRDYQFTSPVTKVGKAVPPVPLKPKTNVTKIFNPLFEGCEINKDFDNIATYTIVGYTNSSDKTISSDNINKGDATKILIHKNLLNGSMSGNIMEGTSGVKFARGDPKVSTDCSYGSIVIKEKPENKTKRYGNPFVGCGSRYVATESVFDVNPKDRFNLTAGNDTKIIIEITNDFSEQMTGHLESYQHTPPIPFNVTKLTTRCIGSD